MTHALTEFIWLGQTSPLEATLTVGVLGAVAVLAVVVAVIEGPGLWQQIRTDAAAVNQWLFPTADRRVVACTPAAHRRSA